MTSISQNYNEMIKNLIINEISKSTVNLTINSINNVNNYINLIKSSDDKCLIELRKRNVN